MTETKIQADRIKQLKEEGYYVIRLLSTDKNGIPDLLAIPKDSDVLFSEVKKPGKKPSPLQNYRHRELLRHGLQVEIYDGASTAVALSSDEHAGHSD